MYYPDEIIAKVRESSDIVTVISRYVTLQKKGHNYFGLCPFHSEKTGSFSVNATEQFYHCFGCGAGGNVFTFLQNAENITFVEALEQLADENHIALPQKEMTPQEKARIARREEMFKANTEAARFFYSQLVQNPQAQNARDYLTKRGVTQAFLKKFGLGYAPISHAALTDYLVRQGHPFEMLVSLYLSNGTSEKPYDRFFNRVMFPIFDVKGNVIAFGGRVLGDGTPKYLNSSDTELFNKRKNLYAMNWAKKSKRKQALLAEGYMDVFSLHQAGFDNAVASLGTALTPEQALLIRRYFEEVCIVYDTDGAGTNATRRAIPILEQAGLRVRVIRVTGAKDPDEYIRKFGKDAFEKLIEEALDPVAFELAVADTKTVDGQVQTLKTMRERLMSIADDAERELHTRDVANRLNINFETLKRQVEEGRQNAGVAEYNAAKNLILRPQKGEEGLTKSLRELLAIMQRYPQTKSQVFGQISVKDFPQEAVDEQTQAYIAALSYFEHHQTQSIALADLISLSEESADGERLAQIGAVALPEDKPSIEQMASEITCKLAKQMLDERLRHTVDPSEMQSILMKKSKMDLYKIYI